MARKQLRRITSSQGSGKGSSGARKQTRSQSIVRGSPRSRKSVRACSLKQQLRRSAFELLRARREGETWKEAERRSGINRRTAKALLPSAFFHDERGRLQAHGYDRYTRRLKIPTTKVGEFRWLHVRGSRKASLLGTWTNALKAAGQGDFSLIDA